MAGEATGAHNQNATRHGLYQRHFTLDEIRDVLELVGINGLEAEIAVMRVAIARMLAADDQERSADLVFAVARGLDALGRALRVQRELEGNAGTLAGALSEALERLGLAADES